MAEYTSTHEGYQRAMVWALTGPPEEAKAFCEATTMPTFYQVVNGQRLEGDTYMNGIADWRSKVSKYKPFVDMFLRDGDQLAAHMTGTIDLEGVPNKFESFMFGKVNSESGKLEWLVERSVWGAADAAPVHGLT